MLHLLYCEGAIRRLVTGSSEVSVSEVAFFGNLAAWLSWLINAQNN